MSLRVVPKMYYSRSITFGHDFVTELSETILNEKMEYPKDFNNEETILLIFDREEDLFTPLLLPSTYQALIHENINIEANVVTIDEKKYTLSEKDDSFYSDNLYKEFPLIMNQVNDLLQKFSQNKGSVTNCTNLQEIEKIVENLPKMKTETAVAEKHINVINHIANSMTEKNFMGQIKVENVLKHC